MLDLNLLTEEEKEQVRAQIKNYHRFEMLIRQGRYYRLTDVWQKKEYAAWEYCRPDGSEALVTVVTLNTQCNPATEYVKLRGLGEDKKYRVEVVGMRHGNCCPRRKLCRPSGLVVRHRRHMGTDRTGRIGK